MTSTFFPTLFSPLTQNLRRSLKSQMESYRGNPNNPILLYHILPTKLKSDEFKANLMAETRHQGHNVRINKYSNGVSFLPGMWGFVVMWLGRAMLFYVVLCLCLCWVRLCCGVSVLGEVMV